MPGSPLTGLTPPQDGRFPESVAESITHAQEIGIPRTFSLYAHIPFCTVRCGYCDFNTYTAEDLGPGASRTSFADTLIEELRFADQSIRTSGIISRSLHSVFFGGGTPTLLPAADLVKILQAARDLWGITVGAEVTTEANPDTVTPAYLKELAAGGFTRVSIGMQSAVPHVLKTLDRTHQPENVPAAVQAARQAGLEVSVDLIYGTPGESMDDWRTTLESAIKLKPDHISAYGLIVEDGTKFGAAVRRGTQEDTDPDDQADKYLVTEEMLSAAGFRWYEVSNWAFDPDHVGQHQAVHNLAYWRNQDWWGAGPGAHSHMSGVRWWNAKHPAAYAQRLASGISPAVGRELPDDEERHLEQIMLGIRLAEGLDTAVVHRGQENERTRQVIAELVAEGLLEGKPALQGKLIPTLQGRLLDDAITRRLAGF